MRALLAVVAAGALVLPAVALGAAPLHIETLGMIAASHHIGKTVPATSPSWGAAIVDNTTSGAIQVNWVMSLDGTQIAFGSWLIPAADSALFTSITADRLSTGAHTLVLQITTNTGESLSKTIEVTAN